MYDKIIKLLNDFCIREYGEELSKDNLKDLTKIPIMYTDYEKGYDEEVTEDIKVQVYADIKNYKITIEYNDIQVYEENYDEKEFLKLLESLDFDSYTNLDELEKYFELKMEFNVINDYGVGADLDERLKIIREIQISSKNASAIKYIMNNLGSKFKIYQYNYDNKKDYDIFSWNSEDERTHILTYNRYKGVQNAIIIMNDILEMLKIIESEIDIKVDVIIKMNNIETDLIRKIKDDINFENSFKGGLFNENI